MNPCTAKDIPFSTPSSSVPSTSINDEYCSTDTVLTVRRSKARKSCQTPFSSAPKPSCQTKNGPLSGDLPIKSDEKLPSPLSELDSLIHERVGKEIWENPIIDKLIKTCEILKRSFESSQEEVKQLKEKITDMTLVSNKLDTKKLTRTLGVLTNITMQTSTTSTLLLPSCVDSSTQTSFCNPPSSEIPSHIDTIMMPGTIRMDTKNSTHSLEMNTSCTVNFNIAERNNNSLNLPVLPFPDNLALKSKSKPVVSLQRDENGINVTWDLPNIKECREITSYELYGLKEGSLFPLPNLWKKIGDVKAEKLPIICTLGNFAEDARYHFIIRAKYMNSMFGPFSEPESISFERVQSSQS